MSTEGTNNGEEMQQAHDAEKGHDAEERKVEAANSLENSKSRTAHLKEFQWQPGQSGNPSGRPKSKHITDRLRAALEEGDADVIAEVLLGLAKKGDVTAIKEVADRTEGKPIAKSEITGKDGGPIDSRIEIVLVRPDGT